VLLQEQGVAAQASPQHVHVPLLVWPEKQTQTLLVGHPTHEPCTDAALLIHLDKRVSMQWEKPSHVLALIHIFSFKSVQSRKCKKSLMTSAKVRRMAGGNHHCLSPGSVLRLRVRKHQTFSAAPSLSLGQTSLSPSGTLLGTPFPKIVFFIPSPSELFLLFLSKMPFNTKKYKILQSCLPKMFVFPVAPMKFHKQRSEFQLTPQVFVPKKPFRKDNNVLALAGISASEGGLDIVK